MNKHEVARPGFLLLSFFLMSGNSWLLEQLGSAEEGRVPAGPDCSRLGCNKWEISSSLRHGVPDYHKSSKLRTSRWKNQGRKTLGADPQGPKGYVCFPLFLCLFHLPVPSCLSTKRMPSMTQGMADADCHLWSTRVSSCGREGLLWGTEALGLMEARAENWGAIQIKPILSPSLSGGPPPVAS